MEKKSNPIFGNTRRWLAKAFADTADVPSHTLLSMAILSIAELQKSQEEISSAANKIEAVKKAAELGFTASYNVAEYAQLNKMADLWRFMVRMWRDLGKNAILVNFDQFRDILRQHDLVCVPFNAYKGDIPAENIIEIENAKRYLETEAGSEYAKPLANAILYASTSEQLIDYIRFPYSYAGRKIMSGVRLIKVPFGSGLMFIAAPKDYVEKPTVRQYREPGMTRLVSYSDREYENRLREQKLANKVLKGAKDYVNVELSAKPIRLPINYDPFVCSISNYGVIIHSMWGPEADDKTVRRYRQLRDEIIEKSKILGL